MDDEEQCEADANERRGLRTEVFGAKEGGSRTSENLANSERVALVDFNPLCSACFRFEKEHGESTRAIECAGVHATCRANALIMRFV